MNGILGFNPDSAVQFPQTLNPVCSRVAEQQSSTVTSATKQEYEEKRISFYKVTPDIEPQGVPVLVVPPVDWVPP